MNFCKNLIGAILLLFLGACSTSKEVVYFQDLRPGESELALTDPVEIKIQPKDKLSILVNSQDLRLTNLFNLPIVSQQIGMEGSSGSNRGVSGYTVDSKGNIDFPVLGEIHIAGMTREEVAAYIKKELQSHDLIKDPVVTVEYMNLSVAVMGEVNNPGRYNIDKDNITIFSTFSFKCHTRRDAFHECSSFGKELDSKFICHIFRSLFHGRIQIIGRNPPFWSFSLCRLIDRECT